MNGKGSHGWSLWGPTDTLTRQDRSNLWRLLLWVALWCLSWLLATSLLSNGRLITSNGVGYLVALAPNLFGVVMILSYLKFLREADEVQQKIQLEALGWGFGSGVLFMIGYRLLERVGAPPLDICFPFAVMIIAWAISQWIATRKYS